MIDDLSKLKFIAVNPKNELKLLEEFIHELAIAGKAISTGDVMSRDEKLIGLKQLNEINLKVLNIVSQIRDGNTWSNRESTLKMICNYAMTFTLNLYATSSLDSDKTETICVN